MLSTPRGGEGIGDAANKFSARSCGITDAEWWREQYEREEKMRAGPFDALELDLALRWAR
jgi:hypothetical protein